MTYADARPSKTADAVARIRRAVLAEIEARDGLGGRVEWLLDAGLRRELGDTSAGWRKAAGRVAAGRVEIGACPVDVLVRFGTVSLGEYAVVRRKPGAALALGRVATPELVADMGRVAVQCGWTEGFAGLCEARPECFARRDWRDGVLEAAMATPELFQRLAALRMPGRGGFGEGRFFGTCSACIDTAVGVAASGAPRRLFGMLATRPGIVSDLQRVACEAGALHEEGRVRRQARRVTREASAGWESGLFFEALDSRIGAMGEEGLDLLVEEVCRTRAARWRLALSLVGHGRQPEQLAGLCRRHPDLAATVQRHAGTPTGQDMVLDALLRRQQEVSTTLAEHHAQLRGWAATLGRLAGCEPQRTRDDAEAETADTASAGGVAGRSGGLVQTWHNLPAVMAMQSRLARADLLEAWAAGSREARLGLDAPGGARRRRA